LEQKPLHPIELKVLTSLKESKKMNFNTLVASSRLHPDQVRRSLNWLTSKGFVKITESISKMIQASPGPPPELVLVNKLKESGGSLSMQSLRAIFKTDDEFSAAIGRAIRAEWIENIKDHDNFIIKLKSTASFQKLQELINLTSKEILESNIPSEFNEMVHDLLKRGIITRKEEKSLNIDITVTGLSALSSSEQASFIERLTPEVITSGRWRRETLRPIDVEAPASIFYPGRRHPVRDLIDEVREVYLSMGFIEITGDSIQPTFWNFDALFTPQDHPARELQDTFYIKGEMDSSLARKGIVARVEETHERGWKTGSRGWRYSWNLEEARRFVLRTHNTVLTIKAVAESSNSETRVFSVGRVYRNENLDYKHLAELHQMEGIIIGDKLNVRHLMGFLSKFYNKLGMSDVKLWPSYFPYTEPSLQVMAYYSEVGKWLEMGGSGIFRPEVTRPLGVTKPVLAWGCGLERLLMLRLGIDDIRELYKNDLEWLRRRVNIASSEDISGSTRKNSGN
jgi:phenylalanyl-tRNA synthetase alpha chain